MASSQGWRASRHLRQPLTVSHEPPAPEVDRGPAAFRLAPTMSSTPCRARPARLQADSTSHPNSLRPEQRNWTAQPLRGTAKHHLINTKGHKSTHKDKYQASKLS